MSIVVTGVNGQLGYDVVRVLEENNVKDVIGIDKEELDITDSDAINTFMERIKPKIIIHCAAYTSVDKAEDEPELVREVNAIGTRNLVNVAGKYNAKFVYISTDYVFSGEKEKPYEVYDIPNTKSVYGETKYLGELETLKYEKHFIIRISWVFGKNGNNFVKTMLKLGKERHELKVVSDQIGSPTYTYDLARVIMNMINTDKYGVYHVTNEGSCSWYEFAKEIFKFADIDIKLHPITTDQYPTKAKRPKNSIMSKKSLTDNGFNLLPHWKDALKRYLKEIGGT